MEGVIIVLERNSGFHQERVHEKTFPAIFFDYHGDQRRMFGDDYACDQHAVEQTASTPSHSDQFAARYSIHANQ